MRVTGAGRTDFFLGIHCLDGCLCTVCHHKYRTGGDSRPRIYISLLAILQHRMERISLHIHGK